MAVSDATKKLVFSRSGGYCAFKGCGALITSGEGGSAFILGEVAHIAGEKPGSARYDAEMTDSERNAETNLLVLCPTHHTEIDRLEDKYTIDLLKQWKVEHELIVQRTVGKEMAGLTFAELSYIADAFLERPGGDAVAFDLTKVGEKIRKNQLDLVEPEIQMGLSKAAVVHDFIASATRRDPNFSDRLKSGFKARYFKLKYDGLRPDLIFLELVDLGTRHANGHFAAALATVTALFEACDIFEK